MPLQWSDEYLLDVAEIDAQHQELLLRINGLIDALEQHHGREVIAPMVAFLEEHFITHFDLEEGLMLAKAYPESASHQQEHRQLIRDFAEFRRIYLAQGASTLVNMKIQKVVNWLLDHLDRTDRKLGTFIMLNK